MKATNILKRQHRQVEKLFSNIEHARDDGRRMALVAQLADELAAHMLIEEQLFYPTVISRLDDPTLVEEGYLEHHAARGALQLVLGKTELVSFKAKLKTLKEMIEHHVEEEEGEMFPAVESAIEEEELKTLGAEMKAMFEAAVAAGHQKLLGSVTPAPPLETLSMNGHAKNGARKTAASSRKKSTSNGSRAQARA